MVQSIDTVAAARYLGMPSSTLVYWRAQRVGPAWYKLGRHVRYDTADLDTFIAQRKQVTAP